MKNIVIVGAGGVGREVSLIIQQINMLEPTWNLIGYIDDNPENKPDFSWKVNGDKLYSNWVNFYLAKK